MKQISKVIDKITSWVGVFIAWLALVMIFLGTYNAITRKLSQYIGVNLSSNMYIELQWYMYGIIFIFGFAYALLHREHVRIDIFYNRFPKRVRQWIDFLSGLFIYLPTSLGLTLLTYPMVKKSWQIKEMSPDPNGLPRYPIKTALILGLFLFFLQCVSEVIKYWRRIKEKDGS